MPTNRLAREKSPYLLQHAHNPVDWYAWGTEAFARANAEHRPIFLSIGYSTCHWCHVMERESFENAAIAEALNRNFVAIKVDREERPDVDRIYMTFVQATTGSGGWPMSVFLTPDLKPFFGGTYFPPDNRYGRPGFRTILEGIARAWEEDRERVEQSGSEVLEQLRRYSEIAPEPAALDVSVAESAFHAFRRSFDPRLGGFGGAPKFPRPSVHNFLLRYYARAGKREALDMVLLTLREMAKGGMHDQLGGGFHRYSVDERWLVPHFEKMLYDQAQLAISYLEAFQITREPFFAAAARDIFEYVLRDMTGPEGAFYSAEDADSVIDPARPEEKGEGAFYIWGRRELEALLAPDVLEWFCYRYGVEADGNVHDDPHGEFRGRNILYEAHTLEETAGRFGEPLEDVRQGIESAKRALLEARSSRARPHLDDKILTAWNALMISAFAKGAQVLGEPRYEDAARRAADFILKRMFDPREAALLRRFRADDAAISGFLDDYAFFIQALIDLYETSFVAYHLELAIQLAGRMRELFEDRASGGFYSTAEGGSDLILRMKDDYDGAEPSGNSIAALDLLRLAHAGGPADFAESAARTLSVLGQRLAGTPQAVPQMLAAWLYSLDAPKQVVIAGERGAAKGLLDAVRARFLPETAVFLLDEASREPLGRRMPALGGMTPLDGRPAAYVCENFACQLPVTDMAKLDELLQ
jgi:uncharacterized protein